MEVEGGTHLHKSFTNDGLSPHKCRAGSYSCCSRFRGNRLRYNRRTTSYRRLQNEASTARRMGGRAHSIPAAAAAAAAPAGSARVAGVCTS